MRNDRRKIDLCEAGTEKPVGIPAGDGARLETIHELVRSGDYHIPACDIADRMIERIIVDKRSGTA